MLGLQAKGPMRLAGPCSRRCGARLLAPIAPCWRRTGVVVLPQFPERDVRLHATEKRGRPKKSEPSPSATTNPDTGDADAAGGGPEKSRRGRKSRKEKAQEEARDLLDSQQIDMEVLEEFKARAAAEEAARREAMGDSGEDDPRRLNFHRSLLAASQRGLTTECARIIDTMLDAGLSPGARAIHVWAYSHIQVGDGPSARRVAEDARTTFGIKWIPETYVALMHGCLSCTRGGPDLMGALELWVAMQDAAATPQLGFTFLSKELFRLRYSALAMQVVSEGYAAGLQPDEKLAALVIEQLCKQGLMTEAQAEMQRLLDAALLVGPDHYDTVIRLEAARGDLEAARGMLQTYYTDPRFAPPRASSYTALLKGLVSALRAPGGSEGGDGEEEGAVSGGRLDLDAEQLDRMMTLMKDEMVARGLRAGRETYAAMVEAFAVVGDLDSALATYETMTRAKGTPALMRKKYLGRLVVSLLTSDRPIDALRLLRDCASTPSFADARSCVNLPPSASAPLPETASQSGAGRSALTSWLPRHYEVMRQRRGQRSSVLAFMKDADMSSRREVDGVVLGLGGCVVTEEGLFVPPAKMTLGELRVELAAGGVDAAAVAGGRKELTKLIKERRSRLPSGILEMQAQLEELVSAREVEREEAEARSAMEALDDEDMAVGDEDEDKEDAEENLDVNIQSIIADEATFEGGDSLEDSATFRAAAGGKLLLPGIAEEEEEEDDVDDDDMEEGFGDDDAAAGGRRRRSRRRRSSGGGGEDDEDVDEDDDDELLGLEEGGAPPLGDGLGPAGGGPSPEDLDWELERGRSDDEDDDVILDQVLNMSIFDSARYNETAGMTAAMRMLELWAAVGGSPTPADLMTLYEGATVEENSRCCADLAEQLPSLLLAGELNREQLSEMLVILANVCLRSGMSDGEAGDRVVSVLEDNKMAVPADVYAALDAALNGRPRLRDTVLGEGPGVVEADLSGSGLGGTVAIEDEDEAAGAMLAETLGAGGEAEEGEEEDEEGEGEELFGEYEEDPGQLEEERQELERLFERDAEEDDAWLDELDEPTADVEDLRAAAEADAAAAIQAVAIAEVLESVRARSPAAAAVLARRLADAQTMAQALQQLDAEIEAEAASDPGALPGPGVDLLDAIESAAAGNMPKQSEEELPYDGEGTTYDGADGADGLGGLDLEEMAAEAEWDTAALSELPPEVLAAAAAATATELDSAGLLSEDDRAMLARVASKAQLLAELHALSDAVAEAHPDGIMAADAEIAAVLSRIQRAEAEAVAATTILATAAAAAGEPVDAAAYEGEDEDEGEDDEDEEGAAVDAEDLLTGGDLKQGVDDGVLSGEEAERMAGVVAAAEALLAEEEEAGRAGPSGAGGLDGGWEAGSGDVEQQAAVLRRLLAEADEQGEELTGEQEEELYDMLERGDLAGLEARVGPEALAWLAEDMQRLAEQEELDLEASEDDDAPELALGWRLNDRFMSRFAAVLRERAAAAEAQGVIEDSAELATVDALMAMSNGYRLAGEEEADAGLMGGEGEGEEVGEMDEVLAEVQREAREALRRLEEEVGGPGEEAAKEAAEAALAEALEVHAEMYDEASANAEEAEEEAEEGEVPPPVAPEKAARLLAAMHTMRPGSGRVFVAEEPSREGAGAEEQQQPGPEAPRSRSAGGRGQGRGGAAGGRKSAPR